MYPTQPLDRLVQDLFEREWETEFKQTQTRGGAIPRRCPCDVAWVLHDLVAMMADSHDHPVWKLEPLIRQRIMEQWFVDECGDCVVGPEEDLQIDREVEVIIRVLEWVRSQALMNGEWSNAPITPQMFG